MADRHHHHHADAPAKAVAPQRRLFSHSQQGVPVRLAIVAVLVLAIWVVVSLLVRA